MRPDRDPGGAAAAAWTIRAAVVCAAGALAFAVWDLLLIHPGFAAWDEVAVVAFHQRVLEGWTRPLFFGCGALVFGLQRLCLAVFGKGLGALHAPTLLAVAAEALLLWKLLRPRFGPRAALLGVALNAWSAFTLLRARSLFGFCALPVEFLFCLWALPRLRRPASALALGVLAGLCLLDYEAWLLALPVLAFLAWREPGLTPPLRGAWTAGAALGLAAVAALSAPHWADYRALRLAPNLAVGGSMAAHFVGNLRSFFLGGPRHDMWLEGHAAFGLLLWPLALLGAARAPRLWSAAALLGLLPLAAHDQVMECNRAALAWAPLVLLSAAGAEGALRRLPAAWAKPALGAALLALVVHGAWAHLDAQDRRDGRSYDYSRRLMAAASELGRREGGVHLLSDLSYRSVAEARFLVADAGPGAEVWAVIPWEQVGPSPDPRAGEWLRFLNAPAAPATWLLKPSPAMRPVLERREEILRTVLGGLPETAEGRLHGLKLFLSAAGREEPGIYSPLFEAMLRAADEAGVPWGSLRSFVRDDAVLGATQAVMAGLCFLESDPKRALFWAEKALAADPRRAAARQLAEDARRRLESPLKK